MSEVRVAIVDDHQLMRDAIKALVESEPGFSVCGAVGDVGEGERLVVEEHPDVLLLDLTLPGGGALELVTKHRGELHTVIVSMHQRPEYVRAAFAAGVAGYVFKGSSHGHLLDAIRHVMDGKRYVDAIVADAVADLQVDPPPTASLSERETAVLVAIARGRTYREIAEQLDISVRTVETYRRRIIEKLGLRTRADFLRYAIELGWVIANDA